MKAIVTVRKEVELSKIIVKAGVRYYTNYDYSEDNGKTWVDAEDDDEETDEKFKAKLPNVINEDIGYGAGDYWNMVIDVESGHVENWPEGFCIRTYFKVCDDGLYQILDTEGNVIWDSMKAKDYYVPDFLALDDTGYGDYICISINGEGYIQGWNRGKAYIQELLEDDED